MGRFGRRVESESRVELRSIFLEGKERRGERCRSGSVVECEEEERGMM